MKAFLVTLIFQIEIEGHSGKAQFDEQVRLVEATDKKEAWEKARQIGMIEEISFVNEKQQTVVWKFINPANIFPISGLMDGEQVFSITHETEDARLFVDEVKDKSRLSQSFLEHVEEYVS